MKCTNPVRIKKNLSPSKFPDGLLVPCGKCLLCRQAKSNEWRNRLIHELDSWEHSVFITLTYSEDNLPINGDPHGTLVKPHLQKFFKRVRKEIAPSKLKYFACGEYGEQFQRPHYHAIIFGLSLREEDKKLIESKWPHGIVHFGTSQAESMSYVSKYIQKKLDGEAEFVEYELSGREPIFKICSQGLGKEFVLKHSKQIIQNEGFTINGNASTFPRYYLKVLGLENTDFRKISAIQADMNIVEKFTNVVNTTFDLFYMTESPEDVRSLVEEIDSHNKQKELNLTTRIKLKQSKF